MNHQHRWAELQNAQMATPYLVEATQENNWALQMLYMWFYRGLYGGSTGAPGVCEKNSAPYRSSRTGPRASGQVQDLQGHHQDDQEQLLDHF